jgi:membrane protein YdbS with pleckstrin-like domain
VPYPDKLLAADEEVVAHLHPHALAVFWPVVRLLLTVGAASFGAALVPAGPFQQPVRLAIAGVALLVVLVAVAGPLLRWRSTHYVLTTRRLLHRSGVLTRRGRDVPLARITDVAFSQTPWERVLRSGTLSISSSGEGVTTLRRVPGCERVQQLLDHLVEEDADRGELAPGAGVLTWWGTTEHPTADVGTHPVR